VLLPQSGKATDHDASSCRTAGTVHFLVKRLTTVAGSRGSFGPMQRGRAVIMALLVSFLPVFTWIGTAWGREPSVSDKTKEVAQSVYAQGVDHFRAGRLLEALAAFRASYDMVPSPNSHLMIARTLRDHADLVEAYTEYGKVILEADKAAARDAKYARAAQASRAERAKVRARLTLVTIYVKNAPDDLRVVLADKPIEKDSLGRAIPILPGRVAARATSAGGEQHQELAAVPGGDFIVTFDFAAPALASGGPVVSSGSKEAAVETGPFPPGNGIPDIPRQPAPAPPPPPDRTWAYVSFGVGAAGLATFVTFAAINQSTFNSLQSKCPSGQCAPSMSADVDKGRRAQTIANVGFGVALAGATVGCILLVNGGSAQPKPEELARRPGKVLLTDLSIGPHAVEVGGVF
jgi:hypothetical protein